MSVLRRFPKRRTELASRVIGDEAVVVVPASSQVHELNPVASFVWQRCDGNHEGYEILKDMLSEFEVQEEEAEKDLTALLEELAELKLVELNLQAEGNPKGGRS